MIKILNYGSLSKENQKSVLNVFWRDDRAFVSWDTPLSIQQYMYIDDNEEYEWIFSDSADDIIKGIVWANVFLYCYKENKCDKSNVIEKTKKIYNSFFSGQIEKIEKTLLKKIMYYYALFCISKRSDFIERKYKEKVFCRNLKTFFHGKFENEAINVLWFYINDVNDVLHTFELHPRYEVLIVEKSGIIDDFIAALEICENAESYDLYITVHDSAEENQYANIVKKIVGDNNVIFPLTEYDF